MNYEFEFPTYVPGFQMGYSHNVIPSLIERSLVENNGIGPSNDPKDIASFYLCHNDIPLSQFLSKH